MQTLTTSHHRISALLPAKSSLDCCRRDASTYSHFHTHAHIVCTVCTESQINVIHTHTHTNAGTWQWTSLPADLPVEGFLEIIVAEARSLPSLHAFSLQSPHVKVIGQGQVGSPHSCVKNVECCVCVCSCVDLHMHIWYL
jgi:hypothetical protein